MRCQKCGYESEENARFCPKCGAEMERETEMESETGTPNVPKQKKPVLAVCLTIIVVALIVVAGCVTVILALNKGSSNATKTETAEVQDEDEAEELLEEVLAEVDAYCAEGDYAAAKSALTTAQKKLGENETITAKLEEVKEAEFMSTVQAYEDTSNYKEAITYINENVDDADMDSDVLLMLSNCEQKYRESVIADAETAYETDGYEAAISAINEGLAVLTGDEELQAEKEMYSDLAPVALTSLSPYVGKLYECDEDTDNMGNIYYDCFSACAKYNATYNLNGEWSTLTATIAVGKHSGDVITNMRITITADDQVIYEENALSTSTKPFDISLDVTGVTDLTIEMKGGGVEEAVILANAYLQKAKQ